MQIRHLITFTFVAMVAPFAVACEPEEGPTEEVEQALTGGGGGGCGDPGNGSGGNGGTGSGTCDCHDVCVEGPPLDPSCGQCESQICAVDWVCCDTAWDSICVSLVGSICDKQCP